MKKKFAYPIIFLIAAIFMSCSGSHGDAKLPSDTIDYKSTILKANQTLVQHENRQIANYIERQGWKMTETGTGLRYMIYKQGNGEKPAKGRKAQIRFTVTLINGNVVYDSDTDGMKSFELGKAQVENGLEEGIMLMRVGDRAKLVIPSHLAFGLLGDENKIPKRATLIYDVELVTLR